MTTIQIRARVDSSGNVTVPVGVSEAGEEVEVVVTPMRPPMTQEQWQAFVERTAGSVDDPSFVRPPQGEFEIRDPL